MQGQEEAMQPCSKDSEADMKALQDELQLVLKKEMAAQVSEEPVIILENNQFVL